MPDIASCPNHPHYGATEDGRIFRIVRTFLHDRKTPYEMTPRLDRDGYLIVSRSLRVHRLVAEAFIPNPFGKSQVAHNNGVKTDNHVSNLRWATAAENLADKAIHGTERKGDSHPNRKLTSGQVAFFRGLAEAGCTHTELAKIAPVDRSVLSRAIRRETWK